MDDPAAGMNKPFVTAMVVLFLLGVVALAGAWWMLDRVEKHVDANGVAAPRRGT